MAKRKNTAAKLPKKPNPVVGNIPFAKGFDPRRNIHGRPEGFDELRALVREIGHQDLTQDGLTRIAAKVMMMYGSKNALDTANLLAYGWGKVKDESAATLDGELKITIVRDGKTDTPTDAPPEAATDQERSEAV